MLYESNSASRRFYAPVLSAPTSLEEKVSDPEAAPKPLTPPTQAAVASSSSQLHKNNSLLSHWRARHSQISLWLHRPLPFVTFSLAHLLLLLLIPALILATLLPEQRLLNNPNRLGFFAVSLFVPIFAFAGKKAPLPALSATSHLDWNLLHRWLGRAVFVLGLAHGSIWMRQWQQEDQLSARLRSSAKVHRGIATLAFLFLLNLSSLPLVRRRAYWLFFSTHVLGYVGALVLVCMHTPYALPWILYGVVVVYAIDLGVRFLCLSSFTTVTVTPLPGGGLTQVWVHHLNTGWKAGQHVHLRVFASPASAKGPSNLFTKLLRPLESHPFTIAAAPPSASAAPNPSGFPLYVRAQGAGTWTGDLATMSPGSTCFVHIEGPYGAPAPVDQSDTLLLVAGGSGATWALSRLDEVVGRHLRSTSQTKAERGPSSHRLKKCVFAWSIRHTADAAWFSDRLQELSTKAREAGLDLDTHLFITRPDSDRHDDSTAGVLAESGCQVMYATPEERHLSFRRLLDDTIREAVNPCRTCTNCTCAHRPANGGCCPRNAEDCCSGPASATHCCSTSSPGAPLAEEDHGAEGEEEKPSCCKGQKETPPAAAAAAARETWLGDEETAVQLDPALIRNGGLTLAVCGPHQMQVRFCGLRRSLNLQTRCACAETLRSYTGRCADRRQSDSAQTARAHWGHPSRDRNVRSVAHCGSLTGYCFDVLVLRTHAHTKHCTST